MVRTFKPALSRDEFERTLVDDVVTPLLKHQRNPLLAHIAAELAGNDGDEYRELRVVSRHVQSEGRTQTDGAQVADVST